jgi:hypothetical protein
MKEDEVSYERPKVRGPSQINEERLDPKFERIKKDIKAELLPKEMRKPGKSQAPNIVGFM